MLLSSIAPLLFNGSLHIALSSASSCVVNYDCPRDLPCCSKFGFCGSSWEYCAPGNCVAGCDDSDQSSYSSQSSDSQYSGSNNEILFEELLHMEYKGVYSGCKNPRHAALTFDDGIHPYNTPRLLDTLRDKGVTATFFILGQSISRTDFWGSHNNDNYGNNVRTLKQMHRDGHIIASHTFDHTPLTYLSSNKITEQLDTTAGLIQDVIGKRPHFMRAPEGKLSSYVLDKLSEMGYVAIHWNYNTDDWIHFSEGDSYVMDYIYSEIPYASSRRNGKGPIILQHDIIESTIYRQGDVVDALREKGYELVSLDVCLGMAPYL